MNVKTSLGAGAKRPQFTAPKAETGGCSPRRDKEIFDLVVLSGRRDAEATMTKNTGLAIGAVGGAITLLGCANQSMAHIVTGLIPVAVGGWVWSQSGQISQESRLALGEAQMLNSASNCFTAKEMDNLFESGRFKAQKGYSTQ